VTAPGRDPDARPKWTSLALAAAVSSAVLLGMWFALVGTFDPQDLVAGAATTVVSVGVGFLVSRQGRALPSLRPRDIVTVARLVPQTITETVAVFAAAARAVRRGERGEVGRTVVVDTDAGGAGWQAARRASVVGSFLSFAPGRYLVDLDAETGRATLHVLDGGDAGR
jgi:multisubunit Na+/H+ antiporter MnhE subunit